MPENHPAPTETGATPTPQEIQSASTDEPTCMDCGREVDRLVEGKPVCIDWPLCWKD